MEPPERVRAGHAGAGAELIGPLRRLGPELDTFAMIPAPALGQLNMDPPQPVPSQGDGAFPAGFPAAVIDALIAVAGPDAGTPLSSIEVRHLVTATARQLDRRAPGASQIPGYRSPNRKDARGKQRYRLARRHRGQQWTSCRFVVASELPRTP